MFRISYPLDTRSPLYPGTPSITFDTFRSIDRGDRSNSCIVSLSNHSGTHIDLPRHFCKNGSSATDLLKEEILIEPTYCCNIPKQSGDIIIPDDFREFSIPDNTRALLLRTGFYRYRYENPDKYINEGPAIHPSVAHYLREKFPEIILFGVDTISISNPSQKSMGHDAHRSFLCENPPIMLLEDADLSKKCLSGRSWRLRFYPIFLDDLDGVPVISFLE